MYAVNVIVCYMCRGLTCFYTGCNRRPVTPTYTHTDHTQPTHPGPTHTWALCNRSLKVIVCRVLQRTFYSGGAYFNTECKSRRFSWRLSQWVLYWNVLSLLLSAACCNGHLIHGSMQWALIPVLSWKEGVGFIGRLLRWALTSVGAYFGGRLLWRRLLWRRLPRWALISIGAYSKLKEGIRFIRLSLVGAYCIALGAYFGWRF